MEMEKSTKNTIKFAEVSCGKLTSPAIGTLYVPKATLKAIGWEEGNKITIDLGVEEKAAKKVTKAAKTAKPAAEKKTKAAKKA